jgi:hypothetical protein
MVDIIADVTGETIKYVQCEKCGFLYDYHLRREATARAHFLVGDYDLLESRATRTLRRMLDTGCDAVPCPKCNWYQQDMIRRSRHVRHRWMLRLAFAMFLISIPMALAGLFVGSAIQANEYRLGGNDQSIPTLTIFFWAVPSLAFLAAPVLPIIRYFMIRHYDPNYDRTDQERELDRYKLRSDWTKPQPEREYPYSYGFPLAVFFLVVFLIAIGLFVISCYELFFGDWPSVFLVVVAVACVPLIWGMWKMLRASFRGKQRIAFRETGIILPRTRFDTQEEFVEYSDISDLALEKPGGGEVTFLHFNCSKGHFAIARQKLWRKDFLEIRDLLWDNVDRATAQHHISEEIRPQVFCPSCKICLTAEDVTSGLCHACGKVMPLGELLTAQVGFAQRQKEGSSMMSQKVSDWLWGLGLILMVVSAYSITIAFTSGFSRGFYLFIFTAFFAKLGLEAAKAWWAEKHGASANVKNGNATPNPPPP